MDLDLILSVVSSFLGTTLLTWAVTGSMPLWMLLGTICLVVFLLPLWVALFQMLIDFVLFLLFLPVLTITLLVGALNLMLAFVEAIGQLGTKSSRPWKTGLTIFTHPKAKSFFINKSKTWKRGLARLKITLSASKE